MTSSPPWDERHRAQGIREPTKNESSCRMDATTEKKTLQVCLPGMV